MLGPVLPDALPLNVRKRIARKLHEKTLTLLFLSPSVLNAWSRDPEIGVYVPASSASVLRLPPGTKYSFTAGSRNYDLPVTAFRRMIPKPSAVAKQTLKMSPHSHLPAHGAGGSRPTVPSHSPTLLTGT